jgi:hypothetical protein
VEGGHEQTPHPVCIAADRKDILRRAAGLGFSWPRSESDQKDYQRSVCVGSLKMPLVPI